MKYYEGIKEVINIIEEENKMYDANLQKVLIKNPRIYQNDKFKESLQQLFKIKYLEKRLIKSVKGLTNNKESLLLNLLDEFDLLMDVHYLQMVTSVNFISSISLNSEITNIDVTNLYEEKNNTSKKLEKERKKYEQNKSI